MTKLIVRRVVLRNWMTCRQADLELPAHGLVLLVGLVGSGKTALCQAITRTLFGVQGAYSHLRSFSRFQKGNTYVRVETTLGGRPLAVETGYRCPELSKTGEALRYTYDDQAPVERSRMAETRSELNSLLGLPEALAEALLTLDGEKFRFNRMPHEELVNLVMTALAQPVWSQCHAHATKALRQCEQDLAKESAAHELAALQVKEGENDLADAQTELTEQTGQLAKAVEQHEVNKKQINAKIQAQVQEQVRLQEEMAEIAKQIKVGEKAVAVQAHRVEIQRNAMADRIGVADKQLLRLAQKRATAIQVKQQASERMDEIDAEPEFCPTCKKPWDRKFGSSHRIAALKKLDQATATCKEVDDMCWALDEDKRGLHDQHTSLQEQLTQLREESAVKRLSLRYEECESAIQDIQGRIHSYELTKAQPGPSRSGVEQAKAVVRERKRVLEGLRTKVDETAVAMTEAQESLRVVTYWANAFGPAGIPNMILEDAVAPLNALAQRVSHQLGRGTLAVRYDTQRELSTGEQRSHLNIIVDNANGSSAIRGSSRGESGLINFIVAQTLYELSGLAHKTGFRFLDEPILGEDMPMARALYQFLKESCQRTGTMTLLIDHNPAAANYADHLIHVTKDKAGSTYTTT